LSEDEAVSHSKSDVDAVDWNGFGGLDRLLDHRVRLAACVLLSRHDALSFSRLKELLGETDGNLGAHLRKLEEATYVRARKQFQERKPVTWYSLTSAGRRSLQRHVAGLQRILRQAQPEDDD
jgi:DNA-binding MarR family transcriptional regulator